MLSDALHPWRYVTNALGGSRAVGRARRIVTRLLYDYLARSYPHAEWTTMNYGYALLPGEQTRNVEVDPSVPEHLALQLYARLASAAAAARASDMLAGLDILEIGSGRGGGAIHVAQRFRPQRIVALDLSATATTLARHLHGRTQSVEFVHGDAENLVFDSETFDVVLNVESAHCYGSLSRFLSEVQRVLRPGGCLAFADFVSRRNGAREHLLATLTASRLRPIQLDDITVNIVAALAQDEARKRELLRRHVRGWFKSFAQGAYAMEGSAMRRELVAGHTVYVAAVLKKE